MTATHSRPSPPPSAEKPAGIALPKRSRLNLGLGRGLFPAHCALCGDAGQALCTACEQEARAPLLLGCPQCALPLRQPGRCGACLSEPPQFDDTLAAVAYSAPFDQLILGLKFHAQLAYAALFADLLCRQIEHHHRQKRRLDLLIPLPLNRARLAERGFNQALEIARPLGKYLNIPIDNDRVLRILDTPHQASLPHLARLRNVRGAFAVCDETQALRGLHIGVIDDVMTTGATLNEMARVLKQAGVASVTNLVVARTP